MDLTHVWLFDKSGVRLIDPQMMWENIPGLSARDSHWALVDSNRVIRDPASVLYMHHSPFFIVQAASPRYERWGWVKYHGPHQLFYAEPFSLDEILQGIWSLLCCHVTHTA
jgi:hypothetical protein